MARLIDAFKQFLDGNGNPFPGGKLKFLFNKTGNKKDTFSDPDFKNTNTNPVILDGNGFCPSVFGQSLYSIELFDQNDVFITGFDDVSPEGNGAGSGAFANWSSSTAYTLPAYVTGSDSKTYKALQASTNVDPVTDDGSTWLKIEFNVFYSEFVTYKLKDKVKVENGDIYVSLENSNIDNEPTADGGVNWELENPPQDWVPGRTYELDEKAIGSDGRLYKATASQKGNDPVGDDGTSWLPIDGVVTTPVNLSPADEAIGISRAPLLTVEPYEVTGSNNEQEWIVHQLSLDSFVNIAYDSGITRDFTGHQVTITLDAATVYSYRVITKGVRTDITEFSEVTTFTTTINLTEFVSLLSETGTGIARTVTTGVDLLTKSGSIWIRNRNNSAFTMKVNTPRGFLEQEFAANSAEAANAQGVTAFNTDGFDVGTDVRYNGNTQTISTYVFQNKQGIHDTVVYTGDASSTRAEPHNLNAPFGAVIIKGITGTTYVFGHKDLGNTGVTIATGATSGTSFYAIGNTSTTFGLGSSSQTNNSGSTFVAELFAHNPSSGVFCGTYLADGITGLQVITGFPIGWFFAIPSTAVAGVGALIADIRTGTSTYMNETSIASVQQLNSVFSFDSDGITLLGNDFNVSGETYRFIAVADPLQFQ